MAPQFVESVALEEFVDRLLIRLRPSLQFRSSNEPNSKRSSGNSRSFPEHRETATGTIVDRDRRASNWQRSARDIDASVSNEATGPAGPQAGYICLRRTNKRLLTPFFVRLLTPLFVLPLFVLEAALSPPLPRCRRGLHDWLHCGGEGRGEGDSTGLDHTLAYGNPTRERGTCRMFGGGPSLTRRVTIAHLVGPMSDQGRLDLTEAPSPQPSPPKQSR